MSENSHLWCWWWWWWDEIIAIFVRRPRIDRQEVQIPDPGPPTGSKQPNQAVTTICQPKQTDVCDLCDRLLVFIYLCFLDGQFFLIYLTHFGGCLCDKWQFRSSETDKRCSQLSGDKFWLISGNFIFWVISSPWRRAQAAMEGVRDQFPVEIFSFLMEFFLEVILRTFQSDSRRVYPSSETNRCRNLTYSVTDWRTADGASARRNPFFRSLS